MPELLAGGRPDVPSEVTVATRFAPQYNAVAPEPFAGPAAAKITSPSAMAKARIR